MRLEVKLSDKSLSINGKSLKLDDSLFFAGMSRIKGSKNESAVELKYRNKEEGFVEEEAVDIHSYLEENGYSDNIEAYAYPEEDFPTIALTGKYNGVVYN